MITDKDLRATLLQWQNSSVIILNDTKRIVVAFLCNFNSAMRCLQVDVCVGVCIKTGSIQKEKK